MSWTPATEMAASRRSRIPFCVVLLAAASACVPRGAPPAPQPPPQPAPTAALPPPVPAAAPIGWEDGPLTPGDWTYASGGTPQAAFGTPGATLFALRCEGGGRIGMLRSGAASGAMTIVTGFGTRTLAGGAQAAPALPASDPLFDQIAFSRGRVLVRTADGDLVLPSWPEPARLIEDCRGQ